MPQNYLIELTWDIDRNNPSVILENWTRATVPILEIDSVGKTRRDPSLGTGDYDAVLLMPFSSGSIEPTADEVVTGATSGATGTLKTFTIVSGSWAGGDAAGWFYLEPGAGTWNIAEALNAPTPGNDFASTNGYLKALVSQAGDVTNTTTWALYDEAAGGGGVLNVPASWKIVNEATYDSSWYLQNNLNAMIAWQLSALHAHGFSWQLLNSGGQQMAWQILTSGELSQLFAYKILGSISQELAWRIRAVADLNVSWQLITQIEDPTAWKLLAEKSNYLSYKLLKETANQTAWQVINVKNHDLAYAVIARLEQDTAWQVFNSLDQEISWQVQSDVIPEAIRYFIAEPRAFAFNAEARIFIFTAEDR